MKPSRRFALWIQNSGQSRAAVAAELGVCRSVITYWCNARQRPSLKSARAIEFLSCGQVPASCWGYAVDIGNKCPRGQRLLQGYLLDHDITVHGLATQIGKATTTVRAWVRGFARPNDDNLALLSRLLKIKLQPKDF